MVNIQLAEPCHHSNIVRLIQQDEPYFTLSIFEKKYLHCDKNLKIIALKNDKIVGFIGGLAHILGNNDVMYWAVDAIVDTQYRKQGIATQLLKSLIYYGKHIIGIGVKNKYILKAERNAGFKVSKHLRTFIAYPKFFVKNTLQKTESQLLYLNLPCFETLLDKNTQTVNVIKHEKNSIRLMQCSNDREYLSMVQKIAKYYHKKAYFLVNTRHYSMLKVSLSTFALPAQKPEILIYTHDYMQELPIYFGHSDWFMEYE